MHTPLGRVTGPLCKVGLRGVRGIQTVFERTTMKTGIAWSLATTVISISVGVLSLAPVRVMAAGAKCQDIPLRVTIRNPVVDPATGAQLQPAIMSDGSDYVDGVSRVSALIMGCSGTYDAVTNLNGSTRTFKFNFPSPIAASFVDVPSWVPGLIAVSGWINIRNILFNKGSNEPFATMAGSTFSRSG